MSEKQKNKPKDNSPVKIIGWNIRGENINYNKTKYLIKFQDHELYGYVPKGFDQYDWLSALDKGMVPLGNSVGVKILKQKNILEIKVPKADDRLYTSELFQNESGDYLAIFNKQGRHKKLENLATSIKKISITKCKNYTDDSQDNSMAAKSYELIDYYELCKPILEECDSCHNSDDDKKLGGCIYDSNNQFDCE